MKRPMFLIFGMFIIAVVALGFLVRGFDPFVASRDIKALFFAGILLAIVSASTLIIYAVAVVVHQGLKYFIARFFGAETGYFKSVFCSGIFIGLLVTGVIVWHRLNCCRL